MEDRQYKIYILGPYILQFDADMPIETFSEPWYHGIIFLAEDGRYQVINNYYWGPRLIINPKAGGCEDIPFKPETFGFLPEGVTACEWDQKETTYVDTQK